MDETNSIQIPEGVDKEQARSIASAVFKAIQAGRQCALVTAPNTYPPEDFNRACDFLRKAVERPDRRFVAVHYSPRHGMTQEHVELACQTAVQSMIDGLPAKEGQHG